MPNETIERSRSHRARLLGLVATGLVMSVASAAFAQHDAKKPRTVHATVQMRPGGPVVEADMPVHAVPVDPPIVSASSADLADDELVLGLVLDGEATAFPIRFLAMFEVVNSRVGKTPVAPTW